jgi:hypothetical protein
MQPEHGGRIELKLADAEPNFVRYAIHIATKEAEWSGGASIGVADGTIEFTGLESGPPPWLVDVARALLRTVYRNHCQDGAWPRRLTRWRPEPTARESR